MAYEQVTRYKRVEDINAPAERFSAPTIVKGRHYRTRIVSRAVLGPGGYAVAPGLGFSLNPLNWIKSAAKAVAGAIKGGTTVTLPSGGTIQTGGGGASYTPPPTPAPTPTGIDAIPGGLGTLVGIGAGALVLGLLLSRRK